MRWIISGLLGMAFLAPLDLTGQEGGLGALHDSLRQSSSVPELRRREAVLAQGDAHTPAVLMERGLVLLRLYELTRDNRTGDQARDLFEEAIERDPANGWAHFGLGLALSGGPGVRVPSPGGVLDGFVLGQSLAEVIGRDPRSRALRQFIKALEIDPGLTPAAVEIADLAVASRNRNALREGRDALARLVDRGRSDADLLTALSRIEAALGNVEAASAIAERAASSPGASGATLRAHAEAVLRQPGKAEEGARLWFDGLTKSDSSALAQYFRDLEVIADSTEIAAWQNADLEGRRKWLAGFWNQRAAASGRSPGERLAEHYQRLAYAQEHFRRTGSRGAPSAGALLQQGASTEGLPFDERGLIHVRHGKPFEIVRTASVDLRPNESWVYRTPAGETVMYHFVMLRDGTDYRLVDDILHALDPSMMELPYEALSKLLSERGPYDARYNLLANRFDQIRNQKWAASALNAQGQGANSGAMAAGAVASLGAISETRNRLAQENREHAYAALETDTDRPHFDRALPFYYDVYSFKGAGSTDVTAAVAVPGNSLTAQSSADGYVYALRLSLIVIDTATGAVTRADSTYRFRSSRLLERGEHLRVHTRLSAPPSTTTVHRVVVNDLGNPAAGQMYGRETEIPKYDDLHLALSDIVLAEREEGTWHRGNAKLALVPPRQFVEGESLTLFYEIYNLPATTAYRTEIRVTPAEVSAFSRIKRIFGGSGGAVELRFEGSAEPDGAGNVQELRRVATSLKPGRYQVRITVTNLANEQTATVEKSFVVIDGKG